MSSQNLDLLVHHNVIVGNQTFVIVVLILMRALYLVLLLLAPGIALADPWCLVRDEKSSCIFPSADACYQAVARQGGSCRENYQEVGLRGTAPWCVVTAKYRRCTHRSKTRCLTEAQAANGGCVRNTERDLELAARNRRFGSGSDCEDLACELDQASSISERAPQSDQVVLDP